MGCSISHIDYDILVIKNLPRYIRLIVLIRAFLNGEYELMEKLSTYLNNPIELNIIPMKIYLEKLSYFSINILSDFTYDRDFLIKNLNNIINNNFRIVLERGGSVLTNRQEYFPTFVEEISKNSKAGLKMSIYDKNRVIYQAYDTESNIRSFDREHILAYDLLFKISSYIDDEHIIKNETLINIMSVVDEYVGSNIKEKELYMLYDKIPNLFLKYKNQSLRYLLHMYNKIWKVTINATPLTDTTKIKKGDSILIIGLSGIIIGCILF